MFTGGLPSVCKLRLLIDFYKRDNNSIESSHRSLRLLCLVFDGDFSSQKRERPFGHALYKKKVSLPSTRIVNVKKKQEEGRREETGAGQGEGGMRREGRR